MEPLLPGAIYHIYNHANGDDILFAISKTYNTGCDHLSLVPDAKSFSPVG